MHTSSSSSSSSSKRVFVPSLMSGNKFSSTTKEADVAVVTLSLPTVSPQSFNAFIHRLQEGIYPRSSSRKTSTTFFKARTSMISSAVPENERRPGKRIRLFLLCLRCRVYIQLVQAVKQSRLAPTTARPTETVSFVIFYFTFFSGVRLVSHALHAKRLLPNYFRRR